LAGPAAHPRAGHRSFSPKPLKINDIVILARAMLRDRQPGSPRPRKEFEMYERQPNLLTRDDTFFGVCQALGEDFGFPSNILRVAFGIPVIFFPMQVLGIYFGLGAIVLLSRLLAPRPRRKAAPVEAEAQAEPVLAAHGEADRDALPMAA
jgi:phage shock protein PspC (stress-responsive transcriptional regulator)